MPGTTLARLVDDFVATMHRSGIVVDRRTVAEEMRGRIADIAERLGVDTQTVLRDHARDDWGRQMADDVVAQIEGGLLDTVATPDDPAARIAS